MNDITPVFLTFFVMCLCPGGLFGGGVAVGWFLKSRGGLPRVYWPQKPTPKDVDDI